MKTLKIDHVPSGLFSELSIRLNYVTNYWNEHRILPNTLCSLNQFAFFKDAPDIDVAKLLFQERIDSPITIPEYIDYGYDKQFTPYKSLPFSAIREVIERYFTVMPSISQRENTLSNEYNLDFKRTIGIIYRGNDKVTETQLAPYDAFFRRAEQLLDLYPNMRFLVQTDEVEFQQEFHALFPNSFHFATLPPINRNPWATIRPPIDNRIGFAMELLAAVRCLARTEHIITGSGNLNMWTVLFRGNALNVHQFLSGQFYS